MPAAEVTGEGPRPDPGGGGGTDPDPDDEDDDTDDESVQSIKKGKRAKRYRVAEEIKLPKLPRPGGFHAWRQAAYSAIVAAAGRMDDDAFRWAKECEDTQGVSDRELADPGKFWLLDQRFCSKIHQIADGTISRVVNLHMHGPDKSHAYWQGAASGSVLALPNERN